VVNLGSTWGQPGVKLWLTWGQPDGSTWVQPGVNLGSTWGQPGVKLGSNCTALPLEVLERGVHLGGDGFGGSQAAVGGGALAVTSGLSPRVEVAGWTRAKTLQSEEERRAPFVGALSICARVVVCGVAIREDGMINRMRTSWAPSWRTPDAAAKSCCRERQVGGGGGGRRGSVGGSQGVFKRRLLNGKDRRAHLVRDAERRRDGRREGERAEQRRLAHARGRCEALWV